MRESSTQEAPEVADHQLTIWNRHGYIFYHCRQCRFLRVVDTYTGNYLTVNHGAGAAIHTGPGIRFEKQTVNDSDQSQ